MPTDWLEEATPLERLGLARRKASALARIAPLSPAEMLIALDDASFQEQETLMGRIEQYHSDLKPAYVDTLHRSDWSLATDPVWKTLSTAAQEVVALHAAVGRNIVRPGSGRGPRLDTGTVWRVLQDNPNPTLNNPLFQQVVAANNPSLFGLMVQTQNNIDPHARALAFGHGRGVNRSWYDGMDENTFASLIAYDNTTKWYRDPLDSILKNDNRLHRYPWEFMPVLLEHNPARFIASVVQNHDVANAHSHVKTWFRPMLAAVAKRTQSDPRYAVSMMNIALSPRGKIRFDQMLQLHAPQEYMTLMVHRQLYDTPNDPRHTNTLLPWLTWMANEKELSPPTLANLDTSLFEQPS